MISRDATGPVSQRTQSADRLKAGIRGQSMKKAFVAGVALAVTWTIMGAGAEAAPQRDEKVYAAVQANKAGAIDLLKQIVNIDSGTGDVAGGTKVAAILSARLKALGAAVRTEKSEAPDLPDNVVAVFKGTGRARSWSSPISTPCSARAPSRGGRSASKAAARTAPAWATRRRAMWWR